MHGVPEIQHIHWASRRHPASGDLAHDPSGHTTPYPPKSDRGEPDRPGVKDAERHGAKVAPFPGRGPANRKEGNRSPASGGVGC